MAVTSQVDPFRRPAVSPQVLDKKVTQLTNKSVTDYAETLGLSLDQKKEVASLFAELQHMSKHSESVSGQILVSKAEAAAALDELAKVAEDWGIRKGLLTNRTTAGTAAMLHLIALARVIAEKKE